MKTFKVEKLVNNYLSTGEKTEHHESIYLQDGDLNKELEGFGDCLTKQQIDIIMCRLIDELDYDQSIARLLPPFLESFKGSSLHDDKGALSIFLNDIFQRKNSWFAGIDNRFIFQAAMHTLVSYYDNWVVSDKIIKGSVSKSKTFNSAMDGSICLDLYWEEFYKMFPTVSVSLSLISLTGTHCKIIEKIALELPHGVSDPLGNNLWLQSRALLKCGLKFIVCNLDKIRPELIQYVLLKQDHHEEELEQLESILSDVVYKNLGLLKQYGDVLGLLEKLTEKYEEYEDE